VIKGESCPTADLSNTGRPNGPAYSTGELLNTPSVLLYHTRCHGHDLIITTVY